MPTAPFARILPATTHAPGDEAIRVTIAALLVAAADGLFYGRAVGISLSVFLVALAAAVVLANRLRASGREWASAAAILVLSLVPAVETIGPLSVSFGFAGVAAFTLVVTGNARVPWQRCLRRMAVLLSADLCGIRRRYSRWRRSARSGLLVNLIGAAAGWVVPLMLGLVFVALFSTANPVFWSWVNVLITALEPPRLLFWSVVGMFVWAFVRVPVFTRMPAATQASGKGGDIDAVPPRRRLGTGLIVRSLILFNAIFALQTVLDAVYLWGGAELPDGVTPAANAQKAAYILVVSALLAAGFVLLAIRDTGDVRSRRLIHGMIYLWIAQNVVLVLSAILRLDLYVELYSLTRLRLAAFVWMALVIVGLILIVLRLAMSRSNAWLIKANLVSLGIALYGCSVTDLNAVVANYNVSHNRQMSGRGVPLDRGYLCSLGPSALPAIDAFTTTRAPEALLNDCARDFRLTLSSASPDWRAWTLREHRLRLYVAEWTRGRTGDAVEGFDRR